MNYDLTGHKSNVMAVNAFMLGVYRWMGIGLALTAIVAWLVLSQLSALSMEEMTIFMQKYGLVFIGLLIGEVVLVMAIAGAIHKMSSAVCTGLFLLYSFLNGLTLSVLLYGYQIASITSTFVTAAAMFGCMSLFGMFTKKDLTSLGSILSMALIGIIIAMVINIFLGSPMMGYLISILGVFLFAGLTAYDSQRLRQMGDSAPDGDSVAVRRGTILGALTLYLDFLNLFIFLLNLFGDRR